MQINHVALLFYGDTFHDNQADKQRAAIYTQTLNFMTIQNCSFTSNRMKDSKAAMVHIARAKLLFMKNSWLHNYGSFYLFHSQASFEGNIHFINNSGGAIVSVAS